MHCGNCATRVENAFNAKEDYWAAVDLGKKQLHLQSTKPVTEEVVAAAVADAGYTLLDFMPETG